MRIDLHSHAVTEVARLDGKRRPSTWVMGPGEIAVLRKHKGFARGGTDLEVLALPPVVDDVTAIGIVVGEDHEPAVDGEVAGIARVARVLLGGGVAPGQRAAAEISMIFLGRGRSSRA